MAAVLAVFPLSCRLTPWSTHVVQEAWQEPGTTVQAVSGYM